MPYREIFAHAAFLRAAALCLLSSAASADSSVGAVRLTGYLHDGPGNQYAVEDEINAGTSVEILNCDGAWCRVKSGGRIGFLSRTILATTTVETPVEPAVTGCFSAERAGYQGGQAFTYCPK